IIAARTDAHFEETNAVLIGIADIRRVVEAAKMRRESSGKKTILLLDEIHHFNKTQQDALLPDVEKGIITLIGITTENPYFYVNKALLSRSTLFEFKELDHAALNRIIDQSLADTERGLGSYRVRLDDDARKHLIDQSQGDARRLLNAIEIGVVSTPKDADGVIAFTAKVAEQSLQKRMISYDKSGDEHYDHVSAFIKSMRGSNPDAALYWMAKMLAAGDDPRFVARRIVICASEDVGNADPHALMVATAALSAIEFVGMPEAKIPLAQAVTYIATAPKSNAAYIGLHNAEKAVEQDSPRPVPVHLKDATGDGAGKFGHGVGYKYPHDYPGHFVEQQYWPDPKVLYEPSDQGYEVKIGERLLRWRQQSTVTAKNKK
ncbi:MAG: replication-associated recombination protein A, partial [Endomicrobiales bacterium]